MYLITPAADGTKTAKKASMESVRILKRFVDRARGDRTLLSVTLREGQNREITADAGARGTEGARARARLDRPAARRRPEARPGEAGGEERRRAAARCAADRAVSRSRLADTRCAQSRRSHCSSSRPCPSDLFRLSDSIRLLFFDRPHQAFLRDGRDRQRLRS